MTQKMQNEPQDVANEPHDVAALVAGLTEAQKRLTLRQYELLLSFGEYHDQGVKSRPYYQPFGITRLTLGGEGQALAGLIKRGIVVERNNLFYASPLGLALRDHLRTGASHGEWACGFGRAGGGADGEARPWRTGRNVPPDSLDTAKRTEASERICKKLSRVG